MNEKEHFNLICIITENLKKKEILQNNKYSKL